MTASSDEHWERSRRSLVAHLSAMGIADARVLDAIRTVPRHRFVPPEQAMSAYADHPLPIGHAQTISQPYIVARMAELLELGPGMRILDVGTGSGYTAAVYAQMGAEVVSIERIHELAASARSLLAELGYVQVEVVEGDGTLGYPPRAPYDAIAVAAAAPDVPPPLTEQLADGGRIVIPLGSAGWQQLVRFRRQGERLTREVAAQVAFVPLLGAFGWRSDEWDRQG